MFGVTTEYSGTGDPVRSMELLWGLRVGSERAGRRGPRPRLSVERIAAAAIDLADTDGLAALSMRRVAEALGVTAMSLYTYVPGKAELIDVMLDRVYGEAVSPASDGQDWRGALESIARANWAMYLRHPWMLQVATSRPVLGPNLVAKYDRELRAVDGIGLSDVEMDLVLGLVLQYVHGAVRAAVEAAQAEPRTGQTEAEWWAAYAPLLEKVFEADRYPTAARVGAAAGEEYQAASDPARAFEFGLHRVLDGIGTFVASRG
jgi:AcrR family transcriptional regulator